MAVLQSHADPSYAALGLLPSIPVSQGASSSRSQRVKLPFLPSSGDADEGDEDEIPKSAVVGYGRIIRDEEGNVIDIILPEDDETEPVSNAGKSGLVEHDEVEKERKVEAKTDVVRCECPCALVTAAPSRLSLRTLRVPHSVHPPLYFPPAGCPRLFVPRCPRGLWLGHFYSGQPLVVQVALLASLHARASLTPALEALAATSAPVKRHTSTSEKTWLHHLVQKHGDDAEAMAADLKLNVWQKTQGEIKRMIKKAGGVEKLQRQAGGMDLD